MDFRCSFCGGNLQNQTNRCLNCDAEYVFDEGLVLSEQWVKAKIKLLQYNNKRLQDELTGFKAGAQAEADAGDEARAELKVKYFINSREPGATDLAEQMRQAGINFSSLPTFGPMTLWIDGRCVGYGATAVKYAVHQLIERKSRSQRRLTMKETQSAELSSERILTSRKEILGALANWTIKLSPYLYPSRLPKGLEEFAAEFDFCLTFSSFNSNGDFTIDCTVLIQEVREIFNRCPTIMKWSASKPINLDTLAKNIVHSITLEARYNKE